MTLSRDKVYNFGQAMEHGQEVLTGLDGSLLDTAVLSTGVSANGQLLRRDTHVKFFYKNLYDKRSLPLGIRTLASRTSSLALMRSKPMWMTRCIRTLGGRLQP